MTDVRLCETCQEPITYISERGPEGCSCSDALEHLPNRRMALDSTKCNWGALTPDVCPIPRSVPHTHSDQPDVTIFYTPHGAVETSSIRELQRERDKWQSKYQEQVFQRWEAEAERDEWKQKYETLLQQRYATVYGVGEP